MRALAYLNESLDQETYVKIDEMRDAIVKELNDFYDTGIDIFDKFMAMFSQEDAREIKVKLDEKILRNNPRWQEIKLANQKFKEIYGNLVLQINKFLNFVGNLNLEDKEGYIFDFSRYYERLKKYYKNFEFIIEAKEDGFVYWLNITSVRSNVKLYATPYDISD